VRRCQFSQMRYHFELLSIVLTHLTYFSPGQYSKCCYRCFSSASSAQNSPAACWGPEGLAEGRFHCWAPVMDQPRVQELEWQERPSTGQHPPHSQIPLACSMKPPTIGAPPFPPQWLWHQPACLVTRPRLTGAGALLASGWWRVSACCAVVHMTSEMH